MNKLFTQKITSTAEAEGFLFQMHDQGLSFHPEDDAKTIITKTGERLFTDQEADAINERIEEVFLFLVDPCDYLLGLMYSTDRA